MQNHQDMAITAPTLPSGGGAVTGLKGDIAAAGPDGAATLSIPLPVSPGRGYAPTGALNYHSRSGNGPFGIGWGIGGAAVQRRTRNGAPTYDDTDEFTGPDGEVLVPALTAAGTQEARQATSLLGINPGGSFNVQVYRSRTEGSLSRLERWLPADETETEFWVLYTPDGQVALLGRNAQARISNPTAPTQTAVWLMESSVSLTGEQMYYQYRAEDDDGCDEAERDAHPQAGAQRYPVAVWYGNRQAARTLPALVSTPSMDSWLFILVFDYGERSSVLSEAPAWQTPGSGEWLCRQDCFSGYEFGFNLRTRRLCRQVLMFHYLGVLAGSSGANDAPALISRLLLDYRESPSLSLLENVHQVAYESDGTSCALPALALGWQTFTPPTLSAWQTRDDMGKLSLLQPYQLVDLNGEGVVGILYQDSGAWWYREPVRQSGDDPDAVTWGAAAALPTMPALHNSGILADLNGDGRLEWVVTAPGVAGMYDRTPGRDWLHFTPLSALPVEYAHPKAVLADILGAGLTDMVLIGPRSVRLYSGKNDGWNKGETVQQTERLTLPVPGVDPRTLVAFSDMAGSGQQHLTEVRANGVRYWPNLGHGRFGQPVNIPGFSQSVTTFNPDQILLADTDGSGTTDLIYAMSDRLVIYFNQSGNYFAEPHTLLLPKGVRYDRTCSLQVADIQGLGVPSLLLTVPHVAPHHWVCHLSADKPWLLNGMNNNMGARHALHYRSSVQFWLDEKAEALAAGSSPACYLPFTLHTLWRSVVQDEITGNRLVSDVLYRHGVWDGQEREFRGFGFVEIRDTDTLASQGTATELSMPSVSRNWYATGVPAVDERLPETYWQNDAAAFADFATRFTVGSGEDEQTYTPDDSKTFWLQRALKGILLRSELYGADGSSQADIPYSVTESRPQVRLVEANGDYPVVWPMGAESRTSVYERYHNDPQCQQQAVLLSDEYGFPLRQVSVNYPRRPPSADNPYPASLPATLFANSYDEQQQILRLGLQQSSAHHLVSLSEGHWLLGLAEASRDDVFTYSADNVPEGGLTLEHLLAPESLVSDSQVGTLAGQQQVWYLDSQDVATVAAPPLPPKVAFIETAVLDEGMVSSLAAYIVDEHLEQAGYRQSGYLFPRGREAEQALWTQCQGYVTYAGAEHFWLPLSFRDSMLTGPVTVTRDAYDCVITQWQDAAGIVTTADYDWRFLTPVRVTDPNDNLQSVTLDALGRVTTLRFWGTENGIATGYSDATLSVPDGAAAALALTAPLPVAQCLVYVTDSWGDDDNEKMPPHVVVLATDRYDSDTGQQVRQQVTFSDGFGRELQSATRQAEGNAWQRGRDGKLVTASDGLPVTVATNFRWAVTGRAEYDNKGLPVRVYQPYFLDSWQYVSDDSARQDLYADTHFYDPTAREWQVITAKGERRQVLYTPWFVVSEDENDTVGLNDAS
ncbi:Mono(ADP-ribosyl)transferase SpvB [Serratia entomophila]|uniref:SepB n=3 Tax=Serratia TaxID=613 RepID=A0A8F4XDT6_SERPR|nr:SpvB/TcaC N-terminal domain-containing protein [Serratia entomophila]QXI73188.1 SepB [Serratia proteamaculans]AAG09643.1 SepB [Serratia entomophila]UIW20834.1 virulence protein [Serratia entomophila]ULG10343.1 SepB [Serratia entomophila]ULG10622.1 SepB [Serratia entomophila]